MSIDTNKIYAALQVLSEEGLKHFKQEYRADVDKYTAIGAAIAAIENGSDLPVARLASEYWEEWSFNSMVALINWVLGWKIYPGAVVLIEEARGIQRLIERESVELRDSDGEIKKYKVSVTIEELTSSIL